MMAKDWDEFGTKTVGEYGKSVLNGYLGSAIVRNVVSLVEASGEDDGSLILRFVQVLT